MIETTRKEMLQKLTSTQYTELWPHDSWDDIGFTENRLWVNDKGYGYFMCDESNIYYRAKTPSHEKWCIIQEKIQNKTLTAADIEATSLKRLYFLCDLDGVDLCDALKPFLRLHNQIGDYYYCAEKDDKAMFFASADQFWTCFTRDWCDVQWTELPDDQLAKWMDRLAGIEKERDTIFEIIE